ncbi:hypothetical protein MMC31_007120, partial [Peltigera leucophlebia]|nr:hypothetical protein [Peltigera leucophlebia]
MEGQETEITEALTSTIINAPVGPALIAVRNNIVKTGHPIYMRVPTKVTWRVVTDQVSKAIGNTRH